MKLKRGASGFWAFMHRSKLVQGRMPFWRVVVEAKLDRSMRKWPRKFDTAITAVFVWAYTIEEAEGLAALALQDEGLQAITADAKKCPHPPPQSARRRRFRAPICASCRALKAKPAPKARPDATPGLDRVKRAPESLNHERGT
ncbi:MAG: hypothetical protein M0D54_07750 [Hyphomonadaceae bacterium JAD_PAG50586_4]|nr:MAG: hypothetical protein M0D54_07750 [Hyphomonadaceae bacterium JAD_PAG50586_4]